MLGVYYVATLFTAALRLIGIFMVLEFLFAEDVLTSSDVKLVVGIDVTECILVDYCINP
jgi:hypothetical protein